MVDGTISGPTVVSTWELVFNHHTIGLWLVLGTFVIWMLVSRYRSRSRRGATGESEPRRIDRSDHETPSQGGGN